MRSAIEHAGVDVLAARTSAGVLAFGTDADVQRRSIECGSRTSPSTRLSPSVCDTTLESAGYSVVH